MNKTNRLIAERVFFTWDIMYECNYNCTYCFLNFEETKNHFKTVYLKPQEWLRIWKDIYNRYGQCHMQITGGEPFVYPEFIDLISGLAKMHSFSISTNLSWNVNEFIAKTQPEKIRIDAAFHPEFTNVDEFLNKLIKLKDSNYMTSVTMVAYPPLLAKIKDLGKVFKLGGFDLILYPYRGPFQDRDFPMEYSEEELILLEELGLKLGRNVSKRLENRHLTTKFIRDTDDKKNDIADSKQPQESPSIQKPTYKACRMGQRYAKILPNGDAFRCCASVWDETKNWESWGELGNLAKQTFNLLERPGPCNFWENCLCYKSMVIGEEKRWLKEWKDVSQMREDLEVKGELEKIKSLRDQGCFKEVIVSLEKLIENGNQEIQARSLLAECYTTLGNYSEAERIIKLALESNMDADNLSWLYRVLAKTYSQSALLYIDNSKKMKEKFSLALDYLSKAKKEAVESNNLADQSQAYCEMAEIFYALKDFDSALTYIDEAIKYQPDKDSLRQTKEAWVKNIDKTREDLEVKNELDRIKKLRDQARFPEAIKALKKFLKEREGDIPALTLLAECYTTLGNYSEAERIIKLALESNMDADNLSWLYRVLAKTYSQSALLYIDNSKKMKEKFSLALDYLSKAKKEAVESNNLADQSQAYCEMAEIFYALKDFDSALTYIDEAIKYQPKKNYFHKTKKQWTAERNNLNR